MIVKQVSLSVELQRFGFKGVTEFDAILQGKRPVDEGPQDTTAAVRVHTSLDVRDGVRL